MRPSFHAIALLILLGSSAAVIAKEEEWTLRIKQEAKALAVTLGATTTYGHGNERTKGSGVRVEKARALGPFSKIRMDGPVDLKLVAADKEAVRVAADDNLEPLVTTVLEGDTLVIDIKPGSGFSTRNPLVVKVDFKQLQGLQVRGSGDVQLEQLKADRFSIDISGSGDVAMGLLEVGDLQARLSGSGDLRVAGKAEQQDWDLSGSGDVSAASLSGNRVRANLSGSGDLNLGVSLTLDVRLSGSGDLIYSGRPTVKSRLSGSGELKPR
jgi:Putative auto-transporter adhesin, head GIN domain